MDSILTQTMQILLAYVIFVVVMFLALNWLKKGELFAFLKVRASRGGKTLAVIHSVIDVYYKAGYFKGNEFHYKNRGGEDCVMVGVPPHAIFNTMGIQALDIDEVNSCLWTREGAVIQGNDPVHVDHLIKRALESPSEKSTLYKIVVIVLILLFFAVAANVYYNIQVYNMLGQTTLAHVIAGG